MTYRYKAISEKRTATGTAVALLLCTGALGGCATSHIGSDWPCPVNQGTPCTSVSAADPAGASTAGAGAWQPDPGTPASGAGTVRTDRCPQGCRPFAWLGRLLSRAPEASASAEPDGSGESRIADSSGMETQRVAAAQRTAEVIGRIWIAPYVDDSGVYHEASWVRVVLEPARWRLR